MQYLLLWLDGTLQSWGDSSRFDSRDTLDFPTKSGLYGLLLASSGDSGSQEELLKKMADAPLTVFAFRHNEQKLVDFHMAGNGFEEKDPWQSLNIPRKSDGGKAVGGGAKRTYRKYLVDQTFAAILALSDDLAEKFAVSLQNPVYDLYLGRKCCVPQEMIFQGRFLSFEEAEAKLRKMAEERGKTIVRRIRDASDPMDEDCDNILLNDVPLRFGEHHLYRDRWVVVEEYT